ncbi:hypothetical protein Nepgr_009185 [Nepenthes gracilis]|uniref:Small auxin up regulated protein n=1 Tax=Nepenthes gracilis TaxID=150966 RepID=A0AAD3SAD2_NEPGR|nr:hypothetical protein Nepgr_009185 [Nepenthes gracilis]
MGGVMARQRDRSGPAYKKFSGDPDTRKDRVRRGYVPLMVGTGRVKERFMVPIRLTKHPAVVALLRSSADEFGYDQPGVLRVPCEPHSFKRVIREIRMNN